MTVFRKVLVAALFVFPFLLVAGEAYAQDQSASSAQTCSLSKLASYDIGISSRGNLLIDVNIDGTMRKMILDTDEGQSLVTGAVAKDLNVYAQTLSPKLIKRFVTMRGTYATSYIVIPKVNIGTAVVKDVPALLAMMPSYGLDGTDGVLGMDVLHNFDLEFDLGHGKLNVFSPDHCAGQGQYWSRQAAIVPFGFDEENKFVFPMQLDGKEVKAGIAAEEGPLFMQGYVMKETFGIDEKSPGVVLATSGPSGSKFFSYTFHSLSAGELTISNPKIAFASAKSSTRCDGEKHLSWGFVTCEKPDLMITGDLLGRLRLYFAVKEKKVYITGFNATLDDAPVQGSTQ